MLTVLVQLHTGAQLISNLPIYLRMNLTMACSLPLGVLEPYGQVQRRSLDLSMISLAFMHG